MYPCSFQVPITYRSVWICSTYCCIVSSFLKNKTHPVLDGGHTHILNSTFFTQRAFYITGNKSVEVQHQQQCIPPASSTQKLGQHQNGMWFIWAIAIDARSRSESSEINSIFYPSATHENCKKTTSAGRVESCVGPSSQRVCVHWEKYLFVFLENYSLRKRCTLNGF